MVFCFILLKPDVDHCHAMCIHQIKILDALFAHAKEKILDVMLGKNCSFCLFVNNILITSHYISNNNEHHTFRTKNDNHHIFMTEKQMKDIYAYVNTISIKYIPHC